MKWGVRGGEGLGCGGGFNETTELQDGEVDHRVSHGNSFLQVVKCCLDNDVLTQLQHERVSTLRWFNVALVLQRSKRETF